MNQNIIYSLLLALFASQKHGQTPQEQAFTLAFNNFLKDEGLVPFLEDLHATGLVSVNGELTKYGNIVCKKLRSNTRNPKQLNFERLCKNSTPGYNFALGMTALNRFFEQHKEGIVKQVTPELEESAAQLCDSVSDFLAVVETV